MKPARGRKNLTGPQERWERTHRKGFLWTFSLWLYWVRKARWSRSHHYIHLLNSKFLPQLGPILPISNKTAKHSPLLNIIPELDISCRGPPQTVQTNTCPILTTLLTQRVSLNPPNSLIGFTLLLSSHYKLGGEAMSQRGDVIHHGYHTWQSSRAGVWSQVIWLRLVCSLYNKQVEMKLDHESNTGSL